MRQKEKLPRQLEVSLSLGHAELDVTPLLFFLLLLVSLWLTVPQGCKSLHLKYEDTQHACLLFFFFFLLCFVFFCLCLCTQIAVTQFSSVSEGKCSCLTRIFRETNCWNDSLSVYMLWNKVIITDTLWPSDSFIFFFVLFIRTSLL